MLRCRDISQKQKNIIGKKAKRITRCAGFRHPAQNILKKKPKHTIINYKLDCPKRGNCILVVFEERGLLHGWISSFKL